MAKPSWITIADSVRGDSHNRRGLPNQDSIAHFRYPGNTPATILAVSDGHGSDKCPRSDTGSRLAVTAAVHVLTEFWELEAPWFDSTASQIEATPLDSSERLSKIERWIRKDLPELIVNDWKKRVNKHSQRFPLPDVGNEEGIYLAYGATLSVAFVTQWFAACLQLGDCEFLVVDHAGKAEAVFSSEHEHIGEDTDSLCMPDSNARWRFWIRIFDQAEDSCPQLIFVCSDGYEKSFGRFDDFLLAGTDFANRLASNYGETEVRNSLKDWMKESSIYSGDDVSVGMIFFRNTGNQKEEEATDQLVAPLAGNSGNQNRVTETSTPRIETDSQHSNAHAISSSKLADYDNDRESKVPAFEVASLEGLDGIAETVQPDATSIEAESPPDVCHLEAIENHDEHEPPTKKKNWPWKRRGASEN